MEIVGTIVKVAPQTFSGISKKNGKSYAYREIIIDTEDNYITRDGCHAVWHNSFVFTLSGDSANSFSLSEGSKVRVKYNADVQEYHNRFFERKLIRSIELCP